MDMNEPVAQETRQRPSPWPAVVFLLAMSVIVSITVVSVVWMMTT